MRFFWAWTLVALFAAPALADDHIALRVLYCGDPASAREADFRTFLEHHFANVALRDLRTFKEEDARLADVIIFDWSPLQDGKGQPFFLKLLRLPERSLSRTFARPSILIGPAGGKIASFAKLKVKPLCHCLDGPAHHLALAHPLFHSPLEVDPKLEPMPTPKLYPYLSVDPTLGPTLNVWKAQTKDCPETDPGTVADLYGFADSPDAEVFAQGVSEKGPDSVPLARHASFFLWGFSAPPSEMTPSGQRLFINAVCYIRKFDGQMPLVRSESLDRTWALRWAMQPRFLSDDYKQTVRQRYRPLFEQHPEWIPAKYKGNLDGYISETLLAKSAAGTRQSMKTLLPESLLKKFGMDADKYVAYYKENLEYLLPDEERLLFVGVVRTSRFIVDEEAKAVGPSNRRVEFLDRCVTMLEKKDNPDRALRLLKRYTNEKFDTAADWRKWLEQNRSRLFFSDVGGYKFFVGPESKPAGQKRLQTKR
jgi:hypothetical protein